MKRLLTLSIVIVLTAVNMQSYSQSKKKIDVVLCLDLSGSTNGLIDKFREGIWDIVNELNKLSPTPDVRIGLVTYGRPSYGLNTYYVKVMHDLTDDFDAFYESTESIKTNIESADTYVDKAIECALNKMSWTKESDALKFIFIFGNGPANVGGMAYRDQSDFAVQRGFYLTPVFVKRRIKPSEEMDWEKIAQLAKTQFEILDFQKTITHIPTPYDLDILREYDKKLDSTYLYFGQNGKNRFHLMQNIDNEAARYSADCLHQRLIYKTSPDFQIKQNSWDLVDWAELATADYSIIDRNYLAENLLFTSDFDLRKIVRATRTQRALAIKNLTDISQKRQQVIDAKNPQQKTAGNDSFARIVVNTVKRIAGQNGFTGLN